jgi:6-phosphogluconolactonase
MIDHLNGVITERLQQAISERGQASLVVSGGETPRPLYAQLSKQPLAWDKVTITLADERWVEPSSAQSNEYMVRSTLLVHDAAQACFIGLKTDHASAIEAEKDCATLLCTIATPFDVVVLGMGNDGHTASLFPKAAALPAALDPENKRQLMAITPDPLPEHAPSERITMTLPLLLNCRWLVLLLAGNDKLNTYNEALAGDDIMKMPVRGVLKQSSTPVCSYWAP